MRYTEHERMERIPEGEREAVARFLEWLDRQGIRLAVYVELRNKATGEVYGHELVELGEGHDPLMYRFWGIDKQQLAEEKDAMVAEIRADHERRDPL
jgi:hypothetical protein